MISLKNMFKRGFSMMLAIIMVFSMIPSTVVQVHAATVDTGISSLAFHALFMAIVGTIWIFILEEKEKESKRKAGIAPQKRRT